MTPCRPSPALAPLALALGACLLLAACGKSSQRATSPQAIAPVLKQGAVSSVVTRNTSRLGGGEAAADAAAVARAVYPALTVASRPRALVLVNEHDWSAALAASVLSGAPAGAPILFSDGASLPEVTREALQALQPSGLEALGGTQVIRVASGASVPRGLRARTLRASGAADVAAAVETLLREISGGAPPGQVILVPSSAPRSITMPLAGLAAQSGAPILFTGPARVPDVTLRVLGSLHDPAIYLVDPSAVAPSALAELSRFGHLTTIASSVGAGTGSSEGSSPVANAIAIARFTNGSFGWGIKEPGHGLVFANAAQPLDGPAAALLSASGEYGPLLLLEGAHGIPAALGSYLADIQPAYTSQPAYRPVRGVYNHGWLIGDESAISAVTQAELDSLLEISPSAQNGEEASSEQLG